MRHALLIPVLLLAACGGPRQIAESWPDGSAKRAGTVVDGKQEGLWTYRHPGGAEAASGAFAGSMQEGPWTHWHADGRKAAEGAYHAGLRDGPWRYWRADGTLQAEGAYRADRQEGQWVAYQADGTTPAAVAWYRRGIWHGPYLTFGEDGRRLQAGVMRAGVPAVWLVEGQAAPVGEPGGLAVRDGEGRTVLTFDGASATLDGEGRLVAVASPPAEPPPAQPFHSMSSTVPPAELPPPLPAPAADPILPSHAGELAPVAILPGLWTTDQEAGAGRLIARYRGEAAAIGDYGDAPATVDRGRPVWHGKPLPQTRFLGGDGGVLDLADWRGRKVVVVVMRGFSGQVCIYCAAQTAALAEAAERLRGRGVETLVVYPGPPAAVPAFISAVASLRGSPPPLPVALDAGLTLVRGLEIAGNLSLPATFILDREGAVRWTYVGTSLADRPSVQAIEQALDRLK